MNKQSKHWFISGYHFSQYNYFDPYRKTKYVGRVYSPDGWYISSIHTNKRWNNKYLKKYIRDFKGGKE